MFDPNDSCILPEDGAPANLSMLCMVSSIAIEGGRLAVDSPREEALSRCAFMPALKRRPPKALLGHSGC
jgi:hypothetical protein